MNHWNDPATYRRLSEPFPSQAEAEKELDSFYEGVRALREKHRIRDVSLVWQVSAVTDSGEIELAGMGHLGDQHREVGMLAWALGKAEEAFAAFVATARKGMKRR